PKSTFSEEQLRRLSNYFGLNWSERTSFETAKLIRGGLLGDHALEQIAPAFITEKNTSARRERGRPRGAMVPDLTPLRALAMHNSDPERWTFPRIADELLNCKMHAQHKWDDGCVAALKQSVSNLRKFLRDELQFDPKALGR